MKKPHTNPWGGRFQAETDPLVRRYTGSLHVDRQLAAYDIRGSRAHVRMLAGQGILEPTDADQIEKGVARIAEMAKSLS